MFKYLQIFTNILLNFNLRKKAFKMNFVLINTNK